MSNLSSLEWASLNLYLREVEDFKSRQDLTDQEVIVMKWMERKIKAFKERI
jgi:hypothetical protein